MLPYIQDTGAHTEEELVAYLLDRWLVKRDVFSHCLDDWVMRIFILRGKPKVPHPRWLSREDVEYIYAVTATEAGRADFLSAFQQRTRYPIFFLKPGCGNPLLTDFLMELADGINQL